MSIKGLKLKVTRWLRQMNLNYCFASRSISI